MTEDRSRDPKRSGPDRGGKPDVGDVISGSIVQNSGGQAAIGKDNVQTGQTWEPSEPLPPTERVRVLFLAANPRDTSLLGLDTEIREIREKLRGSEHRDALELESRWAVRPDDLMQSMLECRPHIVHFSGHGSPTNEIALMDDQERSHPVSQLALERLFTTLKDEIRLVFLNCCYSEQQAKAIANVIGCAIGTSRAVQDEAATAFAASFYRGIGFGRSVRDAFELGLTALALANLGDEDIPQLCCREGVESSQLVLVRGEPA